MTDPTREELLAETEAAVARFKQGLPESRVVTDVGELAAVLGSLPADTPLFLADQVLGRAGATKPVYSVVAHLAPCAEPVDPDDLDGPHRMRPALGLTTVCTDDDRDAAAELDSGDLEPEDPLARAEERLTSGDSLDGGLKDVAAVLEALARLLDEGAGLIPTADDAHGAVMVERSRLEHAAGRLRALAPKAQRASEG
jgi:hypothetical protein